MAEKTIQAQLEHFMFNFDEADKDKSGSLSFSEVFNILKSQGFTGSEADAKVIFTDFDADKNNSVSRDEYCAAMRNLPKTAISEFYLRRMFKAIDKDGSGCLTFGEIKNSMDQSLVGMDIYNETAFELMAAHCQDKDGKISYEEFLRAFKIETESSELRKIFCKLDKDNSGSLTKSEITAAFGLDSELKLSMQKLGGLLIHLRTDDDQKISYEEFIKLWKEESKK